MSRNSEHDARRSTHATSRAILRAVEVLDCLARESLSFSELSRATGIPKSSLHTIVSTLRLAGMIEQRDRRFTLGFRAFALGSAYRRLATVQEAFREVTASLLEDLGETMHLGVRDGSEIIHIANVEGHHAVRYVAREGERLPANATALGKVLLAYLPPEEVAALFPDGLPKLTSRTTTSPSKLRLQLRDVRRSGYALDLGEVDGELRCVATPIFGPEGPIAAFAIAAPAFRLTDERLPSVIAAAKRAGEEISRRVGHVGQRTPVVGKESQKDSRR